MIVEPAAYQSLEIEKIIATIAKHCRSELGSERAFASVPCADMAALQKKQELFNAIEAYRATKGELPWMNGIAPVERLFDDAAETGVLAGQELLKIRHILTLSQKIKEKLNAAKAEYPVFSDLIREIGDFSEEIAAASVIDDEGRLYDSASDRLRTLRDTMRGLRESIRRKGHALLNDAHIAGMLQERVLTLRNGRHAFLVRQDALSTFPGIVVDRSGSGNSVYMEPQALLVLNNQFADARSEEQQEELRIFRLITARFVERKRAVIEAERAVGTIDLFYALSEKKRIDRWTMPDLTNRALFNLKSARHPLLFERAVPIDVKCGESFRVLVVTGPNTGGKTVALKTTGVCITLAWMGFPIPALESSIVGNIGELFADIGDEQSIEQSLSTFSAHVTHITRILKNVTERSVVLLDELGAGTDPEEGAALGIAILDWLREKKALVLATTHHNPIKRYALQTPSIETASVEFNMETLSPTYRLMVGIPGKSNALLIAGKLGMPQEVITRAEAAGNDKELSMEDLIEELHGKRAALEKESAELESARKRLEKLKKEVEVKEAEIEGKKDALITSAEKKAISIVRNAEESARALIKNMESAVAESEARRELEKKRSHFSKIEKSAVKREEKKMAKESIAATEYALKPGDSVQIIGTNGVASVLEVRAKKALVQAGSAQIEVPLTKIRIVKQGSEKRELPQVQIKVSRPVGVPSSIMIRGMTIDEAMPMVEQYLDQAYRAGYGSVTIIHGRGEGILRREVQALCKRTSYVVDYKLGGAGEGGYGVTVVTFKH